MTVAPCVIGAFIRLLLCTNLTEFCTSTGRINSEYGKFHRHSLAESFRLYIAMVPSNMPICLQLCSKLIKTTPSKGGRLNLAQHGRNASQNQ